MTKTFEGKIAELKKEKSESELISLQSKKQEYKARIEKLLANPILEGEDAKEKFNEVRKYYSKLREIKQKIDHYTPGVMDEIDKKIDFYQRKKEKVKEIPLHKDTEEGIAEILGGDPVYQYAIESGKKNLIKKLEKRSLTPDEYLTHIENMYKELLKKYKKNKRENKEDTPKKIEILLPEGMSEQINEELKDNKNIKPQDIEKFLKNELKKNAGEIMISHIRNKFKENYNQAYEYIRRLIINYTGFQIIENKGEKPIITTAPTKREKLISQISNEGDEEKNERTEKNKLALKLSEIEKITDIEKKIKLYVDLYEELGCKFSEKQRFIQQLIDVIKTQTHAQFVNGIHDNLNKIIQINQKPEKSEGKGYLSYKLSPSYDARRILAYPNGEIFTICSHDEYEKVINVKPPVDKRRK